MAEDKGTRKVLRRELEANIKMKVHESSAGQVALFENEIMAKTSDISTGGLGIYSPMYIPEGTNLELELESDPFCPGRKETIHIVAKVTISMMAGDKYRIGLNFVEISDQDKETIINYVQN